MRWTQELDQRLREVYTPPYQRGAVARLAEELGCQPWHITQRARTLKIPSIIDSTKYAQVTEYRKWTGRELQILRQHGHLNHQQASELLAQHGFTRSRDSIQEKRFRMGWRALQERDPEDVGYTAQGVAQLLGVAATTTRRWVMTGMLKAKAEMNGDHLHSHRISRRNLRKFLIENIHKWEPANVDKFWMIDILTNG